MSHALNLQDGTGTIAQTPGVGINIQTGSAIPANGSVGFAPGCVFLLQTSTGSVVYVNTGTLASCTFTAEQREDNDFGSTGLKSDVVNESTTDAGVTIEGVLIKDNVVAVGLDDLTINGNKVSAQIPITCNMVLNSAVVNQAFFTADRAYQVVGVTEIHAAAGTDGGGLKLQLTKDTGTTAPGAGTALLTNNTNAGFDLQATINTLQTGTLTGTTASLQLAAGDRLALAKSGTTTASAGVQVTVLLKPI